MKKLSERNVPKHRRRVGSTEISAPLYAHLRSHKIFCGRREGGKVAVNVEYHKEASLLRICVLNIKKAKGPFINRVEKLIEGFLDNRKWIVVRKHASIKCCYDVDLTESFESFYKTLKSKKKKVKRSTRKDSSLRQLALFVENMGAFVPELVPGDRMMPLSKKKRPHVYFYYADNPHNRSHLDRLKGFLHLKGYDAKEVLIAYNKRVSIRFPSTVIENHCDNRTFFEGLSLYFRNEYIKTESDEISERESLAELTDFERDLVEAVLNNERVLYVIAPNIDKNTIDCMDEEYLLVEKGSKSAEAAKAVSDNGEVLGVKEFLNK